MKTINSFRSKLFALTLALVASVSSFAYDEMPDFQVDGLYYNFLEGDNVEVTHPYIPVLPTENVASNTKKKSHAVSADDYYNLTNIVIPSTVTYEGKVYNVTRIGYDAFNQCDKLTFVDIPSSVKTIGVGAFYFCSSLTSITLKEGLEHIEWNAFEDCRSLENITFPNSLKTIGNYAFSNTLWYKNHPNGAVYAGNVFYKYKGDIPQNTSFVIKEGTVSISPYAFVKENYHEDYSLVSVSIPNSVEVIGEGAFYRCRALTSIVIPAGVTTIETLAFHYCKALKSVTCEAVNPPALSGSVFLFTPIADATLYVPAESIEAYQTATEWKDFGQILPITWSEECYEYRNYNLTIQLFPRKSSLVYTLYHTDDRTIEPPYVDSVWILDPELDKQNPLHVHTLYAQPGDTIALSLLEKNKYYILRVHINECQMSRVFPHRVVKWENKWCNQWNVLWFDGMRFDETASTSHYQLGQDTIIGDYTYRKFTSRTSVRFTEDWKVYVYYEGFDDNDPYTEDLPTGEYLAYDFSAQVGDTLEVFSGIGTYSTYLCVVDDVQQTDIQTALRTITLHKICRMDTDGDGIEEDYDDREMTWIEGVGSPEGFLISDLPCGWVGGGTNHLLCAYKDDELKYTGTLYDEYGCEYNAGQEMEDLFPTLWGLQRTSFTEYFDSGHQPESAPNLLKAGDTKWIGGKLYLDFGQYLREENGKIYIYSELQEKDFVLYDFTLELGDTLTTLNWDYYNPNSDGSPSVVDYDVDDCQIDTLIVTGISTITLLDGKKYKKWIFNHGHFGYVESIGTLSGSFYAISEYCMAVPGCYMGNHLVCASKNGQLLYQMDEAEMERLGVECLCEVETSYKDQWCDTWNIMSFDGMVFESSVETDQYKLAQDTIIGEYVYTALTRQPTSSGTNPTSYVAAVRFTEDKKVYIFYDNTEYLLYDFDVQVGDVLETFVGINHYGPWNTCYYAVTGIEEIPEDGTKKIHLEAYVIDDEAESFVIETTWIEGVGSTDGFVMSPLGLGGIVGNSNYKLLCAYKDNELEYTSTWYNEYGCQCNANEINDSFYPTLAGLQRTSFYEHGEDCSANYAQLMISNRTMRIGSNYYLRFDDTPYGTLFLREYHNRVFVYSFADQRDLILYDWNLQVGDSMTYRSIDNYSYPDSEYPVVVNYMARSHSDGTITKEPLGKIYVTNISTVTLLDGNEYKKWTFNNGMEYIQGLGCMDGNYFSLIIPEAVPTCYRADHLVCASKNNKLLYQMDDAEMERLGVECLCDYTPTIKDNAKNGKIGGRPTPTQWNMLEVETKEMGDVTPTIVRAETFSYTLENDSIVANGKTFYHLARQSTKDTAITKSIVGSLHFGEDNRVYFYRDDAEYVLYDFTAEPGDTLQLFAGINNYPQHTTYTHVVTGKDTIDNGACRMMLEVVFPEENASVENAQKVWLAGLGSIDGIVHNAATQASASRVASRGNASSSETQSSVMLCAWRKDSCLYTTNFPDYDTLGCVYNKDGETGVEDVTMPDTSDTQKFIRDGQLLIIHEGKTYNVMGIAIE